MKKIFYILNRFVYKIIGPAASTRLAHGFVGNLALRIILARSKPKIYELDHGIRLKLSPKQALHLGVLHLGTINPLETKLLGIILKRGGIVFDAGAYVDGWYSLIAAKLVGFAGHVYAFEPNPRIYKQLKRNIALNEADNITLEKLALSDNSQITNFYDGDMASSLSISQASDFGDNFRAKSYVIKTTSLIDYIKKHRISHVDLIKLDIEGSEYRVLKAARKLLIKRDAPDLLVEVVSEFLKQDEDLLFKLLNGVGYQAYSIHPAGLRLYTQGFDVGRTLNIFFTKKQSVATSVDYGKIS